MALVPVRMLALTLPIAVGLACTHGRSSQARAGGEQDRGTAQAAAPSDISPTNPAAPLAEHSDDQLVTGRVTRMTGDSISIDSAQGEKTLYLVPETTVTIDGQDASASDIQQGQDVRAAFHDEDGKDVAVRITAGRATDKG